MAAHSNPMLSYFIGVASIGLGLHGILRPAAEYSRWGLPLEAKPGSEKPEDGFVSPLIYAKAARDMTCGVAFIALQYQGNEDAITTWAAIASLFGLADGSVSLNFGGERRAMAYTHFMGFVTMASWAIYRTMW